MEWQFITNIEMSYGAKRIINGVFSGEKFKREYAAFCSRHPEHNKKLLSVLGVDNKIEQFNILTLRNNYDVHMCFDENDTREVEVVIESDTYGPTMEFHLPWEWRADKYSISFASYLYRKYVLDQITAAQSENKMATFGNKLKECTFTIDNASINLDAFKENVNEISGSLKDFANTVSNSTNVITSNPTTTTSTLTYTGASDNTTASSTYWATTTADPSYRISRWGISNGSDNTGKQSIRINSDGTLWINNSNLNDMNPIDKEYEGDKKMNGMINFDFGPITGNSVHISMHGVAIKNKDGRWVAYDRANGDIVDVEILNFTAANMLYKMPVGVEKVNVGDVIVHAKVPMFVTAVNHTESGKVQSYTAIDPYAGEQKTILPTKNMFNFNFVTKVVSLMDNFGGMNADESNPFGNILPLMMLSGDGDNEIDPMALMMMMNGGGQIDQNMLMVLALSGKTRSNDLLPMMLLMNMNK